jgi:hypothetical protein
LISADALHTLIYQICSENPRLEVKMVVNSLLAMGHRVQWVRAFLFKTGESEIENKRVFSTGPLSVFHLDGDHITLTFKKSWSFTRSPAVHQWSNF